ncbi:MAG TPA: hypothetical protein VEI02_09330 [Planctomycetota bacterium]|nr:hypothetical protein [Planctomycetota bacterium]
MPKGFRVVAVGAIVVVGGVFGAAVALTRAKTYVPAMPAPNAEPGAPFDVAPWESLLERFATRDGGLDYAAWRADAAARDALDRFLAALAAAAPDTAADRFPDASHAVRCWLHGFQAIQVRTILDEAPATVLDVPAPLSAVEGDGLLRRRALLFGGRARSAFGVVTRELAALNRPRAFFGLGGVCPALGPIAARIPVGAGQDAWLDARAEAFLDDPRELTVDVPTRTARLAWRAFFWRDLLQGGVRARASDPDATLLAALRAAAPASRRAVLDRLAGYRLARLTPDWRVR